MKMLKNLKNKKGFTLIEIVIVIVIIAILATMLVPSLLKWVDNANQKSFLEAANSIKTSTLSCLTENYASDGAYAITDTSTKKWSDVQDLVGGSVTISPTAEPTSDKTYKVEATISANDLTKFVVSNKSYTGTFEGGKWTVVKAGATQAGD